MKTIHFYLDFISPYAWLAFDALPQALQGISHRVVHKPVQGQELLQVLQAVLQHSLWHADRLRPDVQAPGAEYTDPGLNS